MIPAVCILCRSIVDRDAPLNKRLPIKRFGALIVVNAGLFVIFMLLPPGVYCRLGMLTVTKAGLFPIAMPPFVPAFVIFILGSVIDVKTELSLIFIDPVVKLGNVIVVKSELFILKLPVV